MHIIDSAILSLLHVPNKKSHKGENGRVLVIAGSEKYHGAMLLTVKSASKIADLIYVYSVAKNLKLVDRLKSDTAVFISISESELPEIAKKADVIVLGPGVDDSKKNKELMEMLLRRFTEKKFLFDAGAFDLLTPESLPKKCILTPHAAEFERFFGKPATPQNVLSMSVVYKCIIVLKGQSDYVSDGEIIYENHTGNAGMTKGGTGDVLTGLVGGLLAQNDHMTAACAGVYLNGLAGDRLYEKKGTFYNAEDLLDEVGNVWKEKIK